MEPYAEGLAHHQPQKTTALQLQEMMARLAAVLEPQTLVKMAPPVPMAQQLQHVTVLGATVPTPQDTGPTAPQQQETMVPCAAVQQPPQSQEMTAPSAGALAVSNCHL